MNGGGSGSGKMSEDTFIPSLEVMMGKVSKKLGLTPKLKPRTSRNGYGDSPLLTPPRGWSVPNPLVNSTSTASRPVPYVPELLPETLCRTFVKLKQRKAARDWANTSLLKEQVAAEARFASHFFSCCSIKENPNDSEGDMEAALILSSMKKEGSTEATCKTSNDSPKKASGPSPLSVASDLNLTGGRGHHIGSLLEGEPAEASFVLGSEPRLSVAFEAEVKNMDMGDANNGVSEHSNKCYKKSS